MKRYNLINVKSAIDSLSNQMATKADLKSLGIGSLRSQVGSMASGMNDISSALNTINENIKKKSLINGGGSLTGEMPPSLNKKLFSSDTSFSYIRVFTLNPKRSNVTVLRVPFSAAAYSNLIKNGLINNQHSHFSANTVTNNNDYSYNNDITRSQFIKNTNGDYWIIWDDILNSKGFPVINSRISSVDIYLNGKPYSDYISSYKPKKGDTIISYRDAMYNVDAEGRIDASALTSDQESSIGTIKIIDSDGNLIDEDSEKVNTPISTSFYNEIAKKVNSTPLASTEIVHNAPLPNLNQDGNVSTMIYPPNVSSTVKVTGEAQKDELAALKGLQYTNPKTVCQIPMKQETPIPPTTPLKSLMPTFTVNSNFQIQQLSVPKNGYTLKDLYPNSKLLAGSGTNRYIDCVNGNGVVIQQGKSRSSNDPSDMNDSEYLDTTVGDDTMLFNSSMGISNAQQSVQNGVIYPGEVLTVAPVANKQHLHFIDVKTGTDISALTGY